MKKVFPVIVLVVLLASCSKDEKNGLLWEKSFGIGEAYFIKASPDSGFLACGSLDGKPYLVRFDKDRKQVFDIKAEDEGLFSSAWFDTSGYITAGSSSGRMQLMRFSPGGDLLWEKFPETDFNVDFARLFYSGNGNLLALATADPESLGPDDSGLLFVRFDTTGQILVEEDIAETTYISGLQADIDNSGNIYLAITRRTQDSNPQAAVAKYDTDFNKLWEETLFNNPGFSSSSLAIKHNNGKIIVSGKTELPGDGETVDNSFLVSLTGEGDLTDEWQGKRYLEFWNEGSSVAVDDNNNILMLNRRCFIINIVNSEDGTDIGLVRAFNVCVSESTDAYGSDLDLNYEGNYLMAGSLGGNFYLAMKPLMVPPL